MAYARAPASIPPPTAPSTTCTNWTSAARWRPTCSTSRHPDLPIRAVVPVDDVGMAFAARLAQRLGLPGAGPAAAEILYDKFLLRQVAEAGGVAGPQWRRVRSAADAVAFAERVPGGLVLKPTARGGLLRGAGCRGRRRGRGGSWERMVARPAHSSTRAPTAESYLVERRMVGRQFNVNLLVRRERCSSVPSSPPTSPRARIRCR